MIALTTILESKLSANIKSEAVARSLSVKPGWKESNFQVMNSMIKIFQWIASDSEDFGANAVSVVAAGVAEKLGDTKIKANATECLDKFADKTGLAFVFNCSKYLCG
jgi:cytoskeleton-associated protein 5